MKGKYYLKNIAMLLICGMVLVGCGNAEAKRTDQTVESSETINSKDLAEEYTDWIKENPNYIHFKGSSIEFEGSGAAVDGSDIRITAGGTYVINGTLDDGSIIVDADKSDVHLVLNGVDIHCEDSAPVNVVSAGKTVVSLVPETENKVSDGDSYKFEDNSTDEPNAAIFSKDDLIFNGTGLLTVDANYCDGIAGKDDVTFMEGTYRITAADDGVRGKDSLIIKNGTFVIEAGEDGLKSTNNTDEGKGYIIIQDGTFTMTVDHDGIQAETILQIDKGTFDITTGGGSGEVSGTQDATRTPGGGQFPSDGEMPEMSANGQAPEMPTYGQMAKPDNSQPAETTETAIELESETQTGTTVQEDNSTSYKGIKSGTQITINGGTYTMDCLDDCIHSNGEITINDGTFTLAAGDDGLHADGMLTVENGTVTITQSYEGLEGAQVTVNGGKIQITSSDDGINTAGGSDESESSGPMGMDSFAANKNNILTINDGEIYVNASGDGLDSNGDIIQNGGNVYVDGPVNDGNGALDYNGTYSITGGTLVAAGSSGMMQTPSTVKGSNCITMTYASRQSGDTEVKIVDVNGDTVFSYTPGKDFASIIIVSQDIKDGQSYTLKTGENTTMEFTVTDTMTTLAEEGASPGIQGGGQGGMGRPEGGMRNSMEQ